MAAHFARIGVEVVSEFSADLDLVSRNLSSLQPVAEDRFGPAISIGIAVVEIGDSQFAGKVEQLEGAFLGVMSPPVDAENPASQ